MATEFHTSQTVLSHWLNDIQQGNILDISSSEHSKFLGKHGGITLILLDEKTSLN